MTNLLLIIFQHILTFSGSYFARVLNVGVFASKSPLRTKGGDSYKMTPLQIWNHQTKSWSCILISIAAYYISLLYGLGNIRISIFIVRFDSATAYQLVLIISRRIKLFHGSQRQLHIFYYKQQFEHWSCFHRWLMICDQLVEIWHFIVFDFYSHHKCFSMLQTKSALMLH